jgi:2Fe-2S ferredoxin
MVKITFIDVEGTSRTVEAEEGSTVMENAIRNGIPGIEAECGGACACATCHVYVAEEWTSVVGEPAPMEEDMLDFASMCARHPVCPARSACVRNSTGSWSTLPASRADEPDPAGTGPAGQANHSAGRGRPTGPRIVS